MKDQNYKTTDQAMPVTMTPPSDEVLTKGTGQMPAPELKSDDKNGETNAETPKDYSPDAGGGAEEPKDTTAPKRKNSRHKKKNEAPAEANAGTRQYGYRALDFADHRNYIQIGCNLYLRYLALDASGHWTLTIKPWSASQLKRDLRDAGRSRDVDLIPRYISMGSYPSHLNYQDCLGGNYNTYLPLMHQPSPGKWPSIEKMMRHIFGTQYELGLDYIQILYTDPKQMLPILLLVSKARQTGKTTFINFLKEIFGGNAAIVNNESLRSKFNSDRAGKLLVMCDEAMQNKKEDSERLKALSTAIKDYLEYKGMDRFEIDSFIKIVLCSNNVVDPVYIDNEEVRYWVIEVPPIDDDNPNFLEAMKREIPAFLYHLLHRKLSVPTAQSRMWFRPEDLATPALARIKRMCRPTVELDLAEFLLDVMDHYGVDLLQYTNSDLQSMLKLHGRDIRDAHRIVCKVWDVPRSANKMAYDLYAEWNNTSCRAYGRYYTFTRAFLEGLVPEYSTNAKPTKPTEGTDTENNDLFSN